MISIIVAVLVFALVGAVVIIYALDPGPEPADIAVSYELAWDRLDFDALWTLSGPELRDGLERPEYLVAKSQAYAGRTELRHLAQAVDVDEVTTGLAHAIVRTRVTLHDGAVVRNDVVLTKRTGAWVVTGYQLVGTPPRTV